VLNHAVQSRAHAVQSRAEALTPRRLYQNDLAEKGRPKPPSSLAGRRSYAAGGGSSSIALATLRHRVMVFLSFPEGAP
jgi:hypothetical protein